MARVVGLFICPAVGEPMQECSTVRALAGQGLEGDRYAVGRGSYSHVTIRGARHVSLIGLQAMQAANEELVLAGLAPFEPHETRRNIVVDGADVYTLLGRDFRVATVRLRGAGVPKPCGIPSNVAGKAGFAEAFHNRGGIIAEVLSTGMLSLGDALVAEAFHGP
jgi:hypothetical protein